MTVFVDSAFHKGTHIPGRKTSVVLDFGGKRELSQRDHFGSRCSFKQQRLEVGSRGVDRRGETGWTTPNDDDLFGHVRFPFD